MKNSEITSIFRIETTSKESFIVAKRYTFYNEVDGEDVEDFSIIILEDSWVEMLPKSTPLTSLNSKKHNINTVRDLFLAKFIGDLKLKTSQPIGDKYQIEKSFLDIADIVNSFKHQY